MLTFWCNFFFGFVFLVQCISNHCSINNNHLNYTKKKTKQKSTILRKTESTFLWSFLFSFSWKSAHTHTNWRMFLTKFLSSIFVKMQLVTNFFFVARLLLSLYHSLHFMRHTSNFFFRSTDSSQREREKKKKINEMMHFVCTEQKYKQNIKKIEQTPKFSRADFKSIYNRLS